MNRDHHQAAILDQFTRQALPFANTPELHTEAILSLMLAAAAPKPTDLALDVACGPGSVVVAFAPHVRQAAGLDSTPAMLEQARALALGQRVGNVGWTRGDVEALPYADAAFDIVSCRFAFHHFADPPRAFAEMARVCRPGGRLVVCDGVVAEDPVKAAEFNRMERHRDPSTVEFRSEDYLARLFIEAGCARPEVHRFRITAELESLIAKSFPVNDDRQGLRRIVTDSIEGDRMGLDSRREGDSVKFDYRGVVLWACKPAPTPA